MRRVAAFNAQNIANTVWAFAKTIQADMSLFSDFMRAMESRLCDFDTQKLANTSWALAATDQFDSLLCTVLARASERRLREFNTRDLANTTWAYATAEHHANMALGLAGSGGSEVPRLLCRQLARAAEHRLDEFDAQQLASASWAFAKSEQLDAHLFAALVRAAGRRLGEFNLQGLSNAAWAFAAAGEPLPFLLPG
eukprot:gnl/TRDRNA2_/TRDRNA2_96169_c0_seq1.p1 gnl/TRDRNA2_/TRDRNA2_96169_c0~~gnl/TRDRNA2_/TRDRNA2_96169_c0_seq1.p1  ORF type:complete len:196 (-),score=31.53 gnl/TRDRNA2_/TRDRNA2_96169_c0_seq1:22-609(-)